MFCTHIEKGTAELLENFLRELALKNEYILNIKKVAPKEFLNASINSIVDTSELTKLIYECLEKLS